MRRVVGVVFGLVSIIVGACASGGGSPTNVAGSLNSAPVGGGSVPSSTLETVTTLPGGGLRPPPNVVVRSDSTRLDLAAWTYCYGTGCADGLPPSPVPSIGTDDELTVEFPLEGWTFQAGFQRAGDPCARTQTINLEQTGPTTFTLQPAGAAGTYDVTLSGRGDGDLFVTFQWTTTRDGPLPEPQARLAVLADHDGRVDSYGVELSLSNLARSPADARASVTVTAANGRSLTFDATRPRQVGGQCPVIEGSVYWDGPDDQGLAAATLGDPPFTYDVTITLDRTRYRATATWPNNQIRGNEPSVALNFDPPLPAVGD